ncbi:hypothetical protein V6Z12_D10G186400 [Gossypium hirsutum]
MLITEGPLETAVQTLPKNGTTLRVSLAQVSYEISIVIPSSDPSNTTTPSTILGLSTSTPLGPLMRDSFILVSQVAHRPLDLSKVN